MRWQEFFNFLDLSLTWGLNRMRLQSIYRAIVEPILMYNYFVWSGALRSPKIKRMLSSTQRKIALLITKGFRTASTESLLLLWLQHHHLPAAMEETTSHHLPEHPPWSTNSMVIVNVVPKKPPLSLSPTDSSTVRAYTDGSVLGRDQVGFAQVIADCSGEIHTF
jgi:hypothetical protein